jgi:uncharacterized protein
MVRVRAYVLFLLVCAFAAAPVSAQGPASAGPDGRWDGAILIMGMRLTIHVTFTAVDGAWAATIDIPQQRAAGLKLSNVRVEGNHLHFELPAGPGLAVFDGQRDGDLVTGDFMQAGVKGSFELARGAEAAARLAAATAASKAPAEALPYKTEEVRYASGAASMACTLSLPAEPGRHPGMLLVTGSGPQTRDEEVFGFPVFRLIADHLTRHNVAVLRCDDRGVGQSTGTLADATTASLAEDARAGVAYLKTRPEVDTARIGLLGHSEGGLIAPMVASSSADVAFIILMSGPGVTGEQVLISQAGLIGRAAGLSADAVTRNQAMQRRVFAAVRTGEGWAALEADVAKELRAAAEQAPEAQRAALGDLDVYAKKQAAGQLAAARSPWFRYFLDADPAVWLSKTHCPVLAIFGGKDLQVEAVSNRQGVERALAKAGNTHVRVEVFPEANHLYQRAGTGGVDEYARLEKAFVPGFLDLLSTWIAAIPAR